MYARGGHLTVYTGGTKACDNGDSDRLTTKRAEVTCVKCLRKLARHDAYEKEPQPKIARDMRAMIENKQAAAQ
jgi:hypothetical protein